MIDNTVIAAQTAADTFNFEIVGQSRVTISADNLAGVEVVDVLHGQGNQTSLGYTATGQQLTATTPFLQIEGPGNFQLSKVATAGACAVFMDGVYE